MKSTKASSIYETEGNGVNVCRVGGLGGNWIEGDHLCDKLLKAVIKLWTEG